MTSTFECSKKWGDYQGITSFSTFPLRMWTYIGMFVAGLAFIYGAWMIIDTIAFGNPVRGYPSLLVSILVLGGGATHRYWSTW